MFETNVNALELVLDIHEVDMRNTAMKSATNPVVSSSPAEWYAP